MTAMERAADIHRALVSLYRHGVPLDAGLRPVGSADARVAVSVADEHTGAAIARHLRAAPGIGEVIVVAGPGRLEVLVGPELTQAALGGLLGRPPIARAGAFLETPRVDVGTRTRPRSDAVPAELIVAAQLAHARCHRRLRRAARLQRSQAAPTGSLAPDRPVPAASGQAPASFDPPPGGRAGHLLALLADQPRILGPHRLTDNPRALAEHLRALAAATDEWLDEHEESGAAGEHRLTQGALRALADALHTLDEPAPARF